MASAVIRKIPQPLVLDTAAIRQFRDIGGLSLEALGLLVLVLSLPPGADVSPGRIAEMGPERPEDIERLIEELDGHRLADIEPGDDGQMFVEFRAPEYRA